MLLPNDPIVTHWVLHVAVSAPVPLCLVYPVVRAETLNVKVIPGFTAEGYAAALQGLLNEGLIQISDIGGPAPDWAHTIRLLRHLPLAPPWEIANMPGGHISFALTARGGATWEGLAGPNWSRILVERSDLHSCEL